MTKNEISFGDTGENASRSTKKVRIWENGDISDEEMAVVPPPSQPRSWKDRLLGTGLWANEKAKNIANLVMEEEFELSELDIIRTIVDGIPFISLSDLVNQLLIKRDGTDDDHRAICAEYRLSNRIQQSLLIVETKSGVPSYGRRERSFFSRIPKFGGL